MNEGPLVFLTELADGIRVMIDEGQEPHKIINNINVVTGFYLQDRDPDVAHQLN